MFGLSAARKSDALRPHYVHKTPTYIYTENI